MSSNHDPRPTSRLDNIFNINGRPHTAVDIDRAPQPEIVRRFGNGYQRVRSENPVETWSTGDDFLRKCLVTSMFLAGSAILALSLYVAHAALSSLDACKRSNEVNSYLYRQTVTECFWSKMDERRAEIGRLLRRTSER